MTRKLSSYNILHNSPRLIITAKWLKYAENETFVYTLEALLFMREAGAASHYRGTGKYPGIFQYPGFIDKYPGIFYQIPGYLTACQIPG